ncbi:hypothetical protein NM688_g4813 [Phlebia brevispora]|uniref:Uncharacterized protein n=1 Tax=Phlebia brevispora TaxID=194682 RepID=A0ACC1T253_9APHY|nr:hypothetical protein NM688_g4813 [Phlebia brevispora]
MNTAESYVLPDLHAICQWKTYLNPYQAEATAASSAWVLSYDVFKNSAIKKKREFFVDRGSELLCAYVYPDAGLEQLRTACDFVNLLFTVDEISDEQNGAGAAKTGHSVIKTLQDNAYDDGTILCQMTQDFKKRLLPISGTDTLGRFIERTASYVRAVEIEAKYREEGTVLDSKSYDILRRENSATRCCLELIGYMTGAHLPDVIFEHPTFQKMHFAATDMVTWSNDVYSYDMEQAMGHLTNNILTVLQREHGVSLQEASTLVRAHWEELYKNFEAAKQELPSFGKEMDDIVARHVAAMEYWVAGNLDWSFATPRYFGKDYKHVRETLTVRLSPRGSFQV